MIQVLIFLSHNLPIYQQIIVCYKGLSIDLGFVKR